MHELKARVKEKVAANGGIRMFSQQVEKELKDALATFELAPDPYIETVRLPIGVVDLQSLVAFLKTIKEKLSKRDNNVKTADWEVAKTGELRLYKLFVCCIHALSSYIGASPAWDVPMQDFVKAAVSFGRANSPADLTSSGKTMWTKTFEEPCPRTVASMTTLVFFCNTPSAPADSNEPQASLTAAEDTSGVEENKVEEY